ncbi:MED11 [Candida pseudojiufengensis]|uniref:MED11 n=1 Tax=Candida pseudojiufengensis TaxID=497109 RepID=UPI0022241067|nr:MED11 [Candida pseudojiufengensis]KAI5960793.1 MED11 [Candida pseudojiufengensis]
MKTNEDSNQSYIQERLNSLSSIDHKVVNLIQNFSNLFENYSTNNKDENKFIENTSKIFQTLSNVAIDLRKEVKIMDENIGCFDNNKDQIMILPINVDQKNGKLGKKKLDSEINELKSLLGDSRSSDDVKMENESEDTGKLGNNIQPIIKEEKEEPRVKPEVNEKEAITVEDEPTTTPINDNDIITIDEDIKNNDDEDDDMEDLF